MKKALFVVFTILLVNSCLNAQYKINKLNYNYQDYTYHEGDPYNVSHSGLASFFLPGLGQMIAGESTRGFAFMGGALGSLAIATTGSLMMMGGGTGYEFITLGLLSLITIDVWAIIDAVRVAKVNNMAYGETQGSNTRIQLNPYISAVNNNMTSKNIVGFSLRLNF